MMYSKVGNTANSLAALILMGMGLLYLLKNSFMPYHSDAISLQWNEVSANMQILILALMRAIAGGYIAVALLIAYLQKKFNTNKTTWIPPLILITGLIISVVSIYATLIVRFNSPGKPPTTLAFIGIMLLITGYAANRKTIKNK